MSFTPTGDASEMLWRPDNIFEIANWPKKMV